MPTSRPADAQRITTNPALGLRAIRLCLTEPQRFLVQLRAMLRASHYGKINILIPMLMNASETDQTLQLLAHAKSSLDDEGIPYDRGIQVGGMIEIPAAALALSLFTKRLDFLSIGTNDLIQYTLAIDRTDEAVAHLYDPLHPAVLSLLAASSRPQAVPTCPVALCGEMAGDVSLTRLLLGLGLRQFSMHSAHLLGRQAASPQVEPRRDQAAGAENAAPERPRKTAQTARPDQRLSPPALRAAARPTLVAGATSKFDNAPSPKVTCNRLF